MKKLTLLALSLSSLFLVHCASEDKKSDTPEGLFAIAHDYEKDERYEESIRKYNEVKNKFPYSSFATKAELAVADVYFKQESFAEAQVAYLAFRELHPKHAQIDYVIYKIGLSYYNQLPETIDRDLTHAHDVITYLNELQQKFPQSEFIKDAVEKRDSAYKKLAEKEDYIGDFYFRKGDFLSCLNRYEGLLKKYPNRGLDARALSRATIAAKKLGDPAKAEKFFTTLKEKFPGTKDLEEARKVMQ